MPESKKSLKKDEEKLDRVSRFIDKLSNKLVPSGIKCPSVDCSFKDSELMDTPDTWGTFKECHTVCLVCKYVGSRFTIDP